jgi:CcmD family protein
MGILVAAYLIVWSAVGLYVIRMGVQQRRLAQRLHAAEQQLAARENEQWPQAA